MTTNRNIEEIEEELVHYFAAAGLGYKYLEHLFETDAELTGLTREQAILKIYENEIGNQSN